MDGMISAYLVQLELSGHADKPYKEEVDGTGQLTTSGNPFKTTIFMTLAKDLRSMYDNFGPQTSKAKTVSVYTLEKCFNTILDISRIENGVEPRDPTVKSSHSQKKGTVPNKALFNSNEITLLYASYSTASHNFPRLTSILLSGCNGGRHWCARICIGADYD